MHISSKIKFFLPICLALFSVVGYGQTNAFKVTLDAGHGAHDFGAVYEGRIEKNIALAVVLKVGKILEATPQMQVNYTRKTDVFIDLIERANIANRVNAHIFVSIHCNANRNTVADGTETYVMGLSKVASNLDAAKKENSVVTLEKDYKEKYEGFDPNSPETMIGMTLMQEEYLENSIALASKVEEAFGDLGKKIRGEGVKQAPFMVLHKAYMPRVLIEMGFISNTVEGNRLNSEEGQDEIAKAIAGAIVSYKKEYFGEGEVEAPAETPSEKMIENSKNEMQSGTPVNNDAASALQTVAPVAAAVVVPKVVAPVVTPALAVTTTNPGVVFKVQLIASSKKIDLLAQNFNGLSDVSVLYEDRVYKYLYGNANNFEAAKKDLKQAKEKGYNSSFLIAFKQGKKINIQEAIQ
ncbi:N-acetylmuramoyl-L-alanine amidase family protein [Flavobacterium turcicum]|uniref:N-acetylmuramoyl-L-alanine amidase n=1 Tax=Flavobacterium turcicum TaxID=2764718 RepID=A0ABR7JGS0_9FLAO|nr:N-acetylmuramoyl-L-alanine amidase [Flavobacterium turcicum]MBC5863349.1 N-acetylmuramoyl-L-alanine amidase [Flavobacterium turcicum]NHL02081.1 N-acetylmuramoyl-L-alanine amidase [Flavobacterium turcicum]